MTAPTIQDIEARARAATPGPWEWRHSEQAIIAPETTLLGIKVGEMVIGLNNGPGLKPLDAEFITHAREDIPFLLAEITALRSALASARDAALEEAAKVLEDAASETDTSELVDRAADAFNEGYPGCSMSSRLRAWNAVFAAAIRALKGKP